MIVHVACLKSLHQGHNIWVTDDFYVLDGGKYTVQTVIVGNISIRILRVKIQSDIKQILVTAGLLTLWIVSGGIIQS